MGCLSPRWFGVNKHEFFEKCEIGKKNLSQIHYPILAKLNALQTTLSSNCFGRIRRCGIWWTVCFNKLWLLHWLFFNANIFQMFARHVNYTFLDRVQCTLLRNNISNILWKIIKIIWEKCVFARKYLAYLALDNEFPDAPWKLSIRMAVKKILLWQCYWSQQRLLSLLVAVMVRHNEKCS